MAEILKGNVVATSIKEDMKVRIEKLKDKNIVPNLGIIRLGDNPSDISYEKSIIKASEKMDMKATVYERDASISTEDLIGLMEDLNKDEKISGILLFRPLPKHIDEERIRNAISPDKDVDCMHPLNLEKIFEPYFTTKHKSQGTGLGLFMSKMIIEKSLEGELSHENMDDGSIFRIKLILG